MTPHGRNRALLTALVTMFALALPASSLAAHDIKIYKVEKHVDITSDFKVVDLSCYPGDLALDGMWRLDHIDQDEDPPTPGDLPQSVDVLEAYVPSGDSSYHFAFQKNVLGKAQLKVFVTCLGYKTNVNDSHDHTLSLSAAAGLNPNPHQPVSDVVAYEDTALCTSKKSIVVQPGYKINWEADGDGYPVSSKFGHLYRSTIAPNATANVARGWKWAMYVPTATTDSVDFYAKCLSTDVLANGGERHRLVTRFDPFPTHTVGANSTTNPRVSCKSTYKAMVAGFDALDPSFGLGTPTAGVTALKGKWWYLGMNPQIKSRDYRFRNTSATPYDVKLAAICLNYRTT